MDKSHSYYNTMLMFASVVQLHSVLSSDYNIDHNLDLTLIVLVLALVLLLFPIDLFSM